MNQGSGLAQTFYAPRGFAPPEGMGISQRVVPRKRNERVRV